ncbi:MAG TPA: hypothetical protein VLI88_00110, partial [Patescibacteria group bacterium]|nr:hypothetical protein [Patescibacteria group bacterium]
MGFLMAAITDPYATPQQYRAVVSKSDDGDDGEIAADLLAVSRYLDRCLGTFFTKDAVAVARVFTIPGSLRRPYGTMPLGWAETENPYVYGGYSRTINIDDLAAAPTSIILDTDRDGLFDDTPWASTDYELWPLNAARGPEPKPYTTIVVPTWSSQFGFPIGARLQVTAQWGWPSVPPAIVRATCHVTGILRLETP